jgi:hypothetical protein
MTTISRTLAVAGIASVYAPLLPVALAGALVRVNSNIALTGA